MVEEGMFSKRWYLGFDTLFLCVIFNVNVVLFSAVPFMSVRIKYHTPIYKISHTKKTWMPLWSWPLNLKIFRKIHVLTVRINIVFFSKKTLWSSLNKNKCTLILALFCKQKKSKGMLLYCQVFIWMNIFVSALGNILVVNICRIMYEIS